MNNKGTKYSIALAALILALIAANLLFGSVDIPAEAVIRTLMGKDVEKASWSFIVWEARIPQALTALLCGAALAGSGLMLQTAFNNPLAGPSILGINSGASLGVAMVMLLGGGTLLMMQRENNLSVRVRTFIKGEVKWKWKTQKLVLVMPV